MKKLEFAGTDPLYPGSKIWKVQAATVTTSRNGRKYTKDELTEASFTLSYRPVDYNHDISKMLEYPKNETLKMYFDGTKNAVLGEIRIVDEITNHKIESGKITNVSVTQVSNETCANQSCTEKIQYGMAYTRLALLENTLPGDPNARIIKTESFANLLNKTEDCVSDCLENKDAREIKIDDQAKAICYSECESKNEITSQLLKQYSTNQMDNQKASPAKAEQDCPEGQTWNADTEKCEPIKADTTPKSETKKEDCGCAKKSEMKTQISVLSAEQFESYKSENQKILDSLARTLGVIGDSMKPKSESVQASSQVFDITSGKHESFNDVVNFFDNVKRHPKDTSVMGVSWNVDKDAYLSKWSLNTPALSAYKADKTEAVTFTSANGGQRFSKEILLIPGGRQKVPVRQYCRFDQLDDGQGLANWYKIAGLDYGAITEGSEPSNPTQAVTKIQADPVARGAVQRIGYSQIENAPFGLVQAINQSHALAAIDDEATDLLDTVAGGISSPTNWVNGLGETVTTDDVASVGSKVFTRDAIARAKMKLANQGADVSPGNLVLFISPKNYADLLTDTNITTYMQYANPGVTATGIMEMLYGVDIVVANQVRAVDNASNPDVYRNILAVKGEAFGLASARNITLEAQRRNEVFQVIVSGSQRVKAATIEETLHCRISANQ